MSLRVFTPAKSVISTKESVELDPEESHYLLKVRRARVGQSFELLDGKGQRWTALLQEAHRGRAKVEVIEQLPLIESSRPIRLFLGCPDRAATLSAIASATALGADEIVLIQCERSQKYELNPQRIDKAIRESLRQCGRPAPPTIQGPFAFPDRFDFDHRLAFFAWEGFAKAHHGMPSTPNPESISADSVPPASDLRTTTEQPPQADLSTSVDPQQALQLFVGPEGGFTPSEVDTLLEAAFVPLALGPWILRTEVAVIALMARFTGA